MLAESVTARGRARALTLAGDASGAVADLGVLIPLASALVLKNGFDAGTVFVGVGALSLLSGLYFGVPFPVQPIKAAAAITIARGLAPATLSAAGLVLGAILLVLAATGGARALARMFAQPIVRGIQLGVGLILIRSGSHLTTAPGASTMVVAAAVAAGLILASRRAERFPVALLVVVGSILYSIARGTHLTISVSRWHPHVATAALHPSVLWSAFILLVVPQIPLTFGNAVVAVSDLEHRYFGARARRITPTSVSLSCGLADVAVGALGGMPMCHGSGGLTAHVRAGARTSRMNVIMGSGLLVLGLFFGRAALTLLALIPVAVLMGFLFFAGVLHAWLVADRRGYELIVAVAMGVVGAVTSNLAVSLALGLLLWWPVKIARIP
ncbi:MAG: putative sulfate/molybdate transporter [Actinomycetota bacterium]